MNDIKFQDKIQTGGPNGKMKSEREEVNKEWIIGMQG